MKKIMILLAMVLIITSCGNKKTQDTNEQTNAQTEIQTPPDTHNAQNSLSYGGTYVGTTPCADCEGIEIELTIDYNGNYTKKMTYLGKGEGNTFTTEGNYKWNDAGNTISLATEHGKDMYFVAENQLFMLDQEGKRVTGEFADMYILKQTDWIE